MKKMTEMKKKLAGGMILLTALSGCGQADVKMTDTSTDLVIEAETEMETGIEKSTDSGTETGGSEKGKEKNQEKISATVKEGSLVAALAGKWRLASEKTEEGILPKEAGETSLQGERDSLAGDTPSKEDIPLKEDTPLETSADNGETLPAAYGKTLWDVYRKGILPDGHQLEYRDTEMAERNYFAICDVDGDGRKELLIHWSNPVSVAGMAEYVLDSDGGQCYTELSEYPSLCYYDNGSVEADWSHNQGKAGRIWPKHFYRYNQEKDIYESYGSMDAWDKSLEKEGFPDEIDVDGDGLVYYLMPADWNADYWNGGYEKKVTVDGSDYEAWRSECVGDARMIQPEYQYLTPENIEALGFMESE